MLNNLKSDLYRVFHMKAFYITIGIGALMSVLLLISVGFSMSSPYCNFIRENDTFVHFMYYIVKSPLFALLALVFLSVFHNDEYDKGYAKNIMPIMYKKSTLMIERYLVNIIVCFIIIALMIIVSSIINLIYPLEHIESINVIDFSIYAIMEILLVSCVASFIVMINNLTRSRVIIIIIACVFSMLILHMLEMAVANWILGNGDILKYTLYQQIGTLPEVFSWEGYKIAFFVLIGNTVLYNGISYFILKKKDI